MENEEEKQQQRRQQLIALSAREGRGGDEYKQ